MFKALLFDGLGLKGIPLQGLSEEAWHFVLGGSKGGDLLTFYEDVPWLNRGVDLRRNAVASMPYTFLRGDEEIDSDPVLPFDLDMNGLLEDIETDMSLHGAAYLDKGLNIIRRPKALRRLLPTSITVKSSPRAGLEGFERAVGGERIAYAEDELVYIWLPNARSEVGPGTSPARAALKAAGALRNIDDLISGFFARGAIKPTIVTVPTGTPTPERDRVQNWFERMASGVKNAFRYLAVAAEIKFATIGSDPKDLTMPELTDSKREDVATALGIPHSLLFSNAANYATARQDDVHFYDKTIIPQVRRIERALNKQLFEPLGYTLKFQPEKLEIYQQLEAEKVDKLEVMFRNGWIDVNESREQVGLPPRAALPAPEKPAAIPAEADMVVDGQAEVIPGARDELRRWRRFAEKRFEEGKPAKAQEFESAVLAPSFTAAIKGALAAAQSVDDVGAVFANALTWEGYP